ncbi:unnamed protein product, partial [Brassica oleracea]
LSLYILILSNISLISHRCLASSALPRPLGLLPEPLCLLSLCLSLSLCLWSVKSLSGGFLWWVSTMREAPSSSASGRLPLSVARGWVRSGTCRGSRV